MDRVRSVQIISGGGQFLIPFIFGSQTLDMKRENCLSNQISYPLPLIVRTRLLGYKEEGEGTEWEKGGNERRKKGYLEGNERRNVENGGRRVLSPWRGF